MADPWVAHRKIRWRKNDGTESLQKHFIRFIAPLSGTLPLVFSVARQTRLSILQL